MEVRALMNELKYSFHEANASAFIEWLKSQCLVDPEYADGVVLSLYYESPRYDFLCQKINSDYVKTKLRIRWYQNLIGDTSHFKSYVEVKRKLGRTRFKYRQETPWSAAQMNEMSLNDERLYDLNAIWPNPPMPLNYELRPFILIRYRRHRFIDPISQARLNVDDQIQVLKCNQALTTIQNPSTINQAVFEFKSKENELPLRLKPAFSFGLKRKAFSKYLYCCHKVKI